MTTTAIPPVGDPFTYVTRSGYKLVQNRPYDCRYACRCGGCNGVVVEHVSTVARVIHWADNSIEVELADGGRQTLVPPHGDACF